MMAVGAVSRDHPTIQEPYSSEGPTADGRIKPDIAAPTWVSTATAGDSGFSGTSGASPHVAGAAALVLQTNRRLSPAQVKTFLQQRAVDLGSDGPDNQFGHGRLDLGGPSGMPILQIYRPLMGR